MFILVYKDLRINGEYFRGKIKKSVRIFDIFDILTQKLHPLQGVICAHNILSLLGMEWAL